MSQTPAFRHDPLKSTLVLTVARDEPDWFREPAVCGYRRLTHESPAKGGPVPVPVCATPVVVTGAGVVVAGYDGRVRFFDRALNRTFWTRRLNAAVYAPVVVDPDRRTIVVATVDGTVVCFDLRGDVRWSVETGAALYATPTLLPQHRRIVFAAFDSRCLSLDLDTGEQVFARDLPRPWHSAHGGSAAHRDPYAGPVATKDSQVILCCAEHVVCLAPDGRELWRTEIGHAVRASPALLHAADEVVVCSVDGRCVFLDVHAGVRRGEVSLGGKVVTSPALSGHILVVGTQGGVSHGVDVRTRTVVWTSSYCAPRDHTSFTVLPSGDFALTAERGNVVGLSRDDGSFLWETSQLLGLAEHDPALDTTPVAGPDGSMYCGSYSGMVYHLLFPPLVALEAE